MVKFSKQFEGQLVPEWKEAFVDYWQLKKELKKIHQFNNQNMNKNQNDNKSFSNTLLSSLRRYTFMQHKQREHNAIQVHRKFAASSREGDLYVTELVEQFADDAAAEFFSCLDLQLNKVNQFFMKKEDEFLERGDSLKKQIEILIELKTEVKQRRAKGRSQESREDNSISGTLSCDEDLVRSGEEVEQGLENSTDETDEFDLELADSPKSGEIGKSIKMKKDEMKLRRLSSRVINCKGKNMRVHIPLTTPKRTFSAISYLIWDDLANNSSKKCGLKDNKLHIDRRKLHHAEKMIKGALIELYKGLGHLKTYRNLNMLAFAKILKKFDKVTNKQVLSIYLRVVESSYFNSSDKALKLADEIEELFVKHFAQDDRRKAMKYLKPAQRKDSHSVTFFIGLFTGCFLALFAGYVITAHLTGVYHSEPDGMYMETVFPVLSMFSLLFLHLFLYGCNIVMWRKMRINYSFVFELPPRRDLKYRDIFLICSTSMAAVVGALLVHLSLIAKGYSLLENIDFATENLQPKKFGCNLMNLAT